MDARTALSTDDLAPEAEPGDQLERGAPYVEPALTGLGTVTELTEGLKGGGPVDAGTGSTFT